MSNYTVFGTPAAALTSDTFTVEETAGVNGWVGGLAAVQIVQILPTTFTWNGGGTTNWNTASNWDVNAVPNAAGDSVIFGRPVRRALRTLRPPPSP